MDYPTTPVDDHRDDQDEEETSEETPKEGVMEEATPAAGGDQAEEAGEKTPVTGQEDSAKSEDSAE